jgi:hypothetical protein
MNNSNMCCNTLQAIVGMFAHSTGTSEKMVEFLSHAGLSIAPISINQMVSHMSSEAQRSLKDELAGLVSAIGYDNLEVRFDTEQPTAEKQGKLVSMTTAAFFPLRAGVTKEDLRVCEELWARSEFNPHRSLPPVLLSHDRMMSMMRKTSFGLGDERSIESLFAWHARDILLNENVDTLPLDIKQLFRKESLGSPAQRSSLSHTKTPQKLMRTMDISVSTTHGNAAAIENMLEQGGAAKEALKAYVILFHGDLGTAKRFGVCRRVEGSRRRVTDSSILFSSRGGSTSVWRWRIRYVDSGSIPKGLAPVIQPILHPYSTYAPCYALEKSEKLAVTPDFDERTV